MGDHALNWTTNTRRTTVKQDEARTGHARNLVRAFALLEVLADAPEGRTLAALAAATQLPEATAHRLLTVLADLGVARPGDAGNWRIGRHCLELGAAYLDSVEIRTEARAPMQRLTEETGETCALGVLDDDRVVYVEKVDSRHPVRMHSAIGRSNPACTSSLGRAILAASPESVVDHVLGRAAGTDPDAVRAELGRCRERGYSLDDAENEPGIRGVGAPVLDYRGWPVAALSVAGPVQRVSRERMHELGLATAAVAAELSRRLGYSPRIRERFGDHPRAGGLA
jgi:DNA-binding IclR family transcriptional regulator